MYAQDETGQRAALRGFAVGQTPAQQAAMVLDLTGTATETERAQDALLQTIASLSGEALENAFARYITSGVSSGSLEGNLRAFGAEAAQTVTQLRLYADSFSARETLGAVLRGYAETVTYADGASGLVQPGMALMESAEKTDRLGMALTGVLAGAFIVLVSALAASARRRELWQLRMLGLSSPQGIVGAESRCSVFSAACSERALRGRFARCSARSAARRSRSRGRPPALQRSPRRSFRGSPAGSARPAYGSKRSMV